MSSTLVPLKILQIASQYWIYAGCITFTTGIVGNTINILVFTNLKAFRNNRCAFYLTIESISNFLYQFFSITLTILISLYGNDLTSNSLIWCKFKYLLAESFGLITFYMICFQAVDQFFSTNYRLILRQMCTLKLARCLAFTTVCLWLSHSILCSFFVNIVPSIGCIISNPIWIQYVTFFFYPVLVGLLPIFIASSFSLLAYYNVRRIVRRQIPIERRRFDRQITAMVLIHVVFFVFFTLPYIVYRIYVVNVPVTQENLLNFAIMQLLEVIVVSIVDLNYTVKYFLYLLYV
jgi:hypothetical protein